MSAQRAPLPGRADGAAQRAGSGPAVPAGAAVCIMPGCDLPGLVYMLKGGVWFCIECYSAIWADRRTQRARRLAQRRKVFRGWL